MNYTPWAAHQLDELFEAKRSTMTPPTKQEQTVRPEIKLKADILLKQEIALRIKELEEERHKIDADLAELLISTGKKDEKGRLYLTTDEHLLRLVEKDGRKLLSREKLLELGVPITTLNEGTVIGKPSIFPQVFARNGKVR